MIRYNVATGQRVQSDKQDAFIEEIISVCKKYNMSISHEDLQGAFEIKKHSKLNDEWLRQAHDAMGPPPPHVKVIKRE
jgi:hypothetical protein